MFFFFFFNALILLKYSKPPVCFWAFLPGDQFNFKGITNQKKMWGGRWEVRKAYLNYKAVIKKTANTVIASHSLLRWQ